MDKIDKIAAAHEAWKVANRKRPGTRYTAAGEEAMHEAWPYLLALCAWAVAALHLKEQSNASSDPSLGPSPD